MEPKATPRRIDTRIGKTKPKASRNKKAGSPVIKPRPNRATVPITQDSNVEALRERAFLSLQWAYGAVLLVSVIIVFLQGFQVAGFHLPMEFIYWLGAATVGKLATYTYLMLRFFFPAPVPTEESQIQPIDQNTG